MAACDRTGGSATGEGDLWLKSFQQHPVLPEEGDGQVGDPVEGIHLVSRDAQPFQKGPIDGVLRRMEAK